MSKKKETAIKIDAQLNESKIFIPCELKKNEHYALKIPALGFHASTRTGALKFVDGGVSFDAAVGDELGMDYKLISIKDKKVVATGKIVIVSGEENTGSNVAPTNDKKNDSKTDKKD